MSKKLYSVCRAQETNRLDILDASYSAVLNRRIESPADGPAVVGGIVNHRPVSLAGHIRLAGRRAIRPTEDRSGGSPGSSESGENGAGKVHNGLTQRTV